ncbi:hypothetical protein, partial [Komagataeibacter kakiaceti]|uniref:hypothetical protein n=1 Tax=Komagataeibacter kakiaceti TaxID=943261 RepID=UPI003899096D
MPISAACSRARNPGSAVRTHDRPRCRDASACLRVARTDGIGPVSYRRLIQT